MLFGQQRNTMFMDPEWLAVPLPATPRYATTVLESHAERLLTELSPVARTRNSVSERVVDRITSGARTMVAVAQDLGMSRAILYRVLRAEGTTFEQINETVRRDLAIRMLREGQSIAETSDPLGFSERSTFSRAFKRWTGASPGSA